MNDFDRSSQERERAWVEREHRRTGGPAPPPPGSRSAHRRRRIVAAVAAVVVLVALWFLGSLIQPFHGSGGENVAVTIAKGATVGEIGDTLAGKDVVASSFFFGLRARLSGKSGDFKAGNYLMKKGMSYGAAIDLLAGKPNASIIHLVIPEGKSRYEIAQFAETAGVTGDYMAASKSARGFDPRRYGAPANAGSLEGFLFPATYQLPPGTRATTLVQQQLAAFRRNIATVSMRYARSKNLTTYDVLTIASLIEREVSVPRERALVAAVVYNRLHQGVPLGIDATTRFEFRNWTQPLTNAQLQTRSPYNTRLNRGLPPTPIGNPGLAAIEAAAHPARVSYLYYVANPCKPGTHSFSATYAQFQRNVQRYNDARARAGGNQPSGC